MKFKPAFTRHPSRRQHTDWNVHFRNEGMKKSGFIHSLMDYCSTTEHTDESTALSFY